MEKMPFGSPAQGSYDEDYEKNKLGNLHPDAFLWPTLTPPSSLEARVAALEARCTELETKLQDSEKRQSMGLWHLNQFCAVNMPSLRSQLGVGNGWTPAHITAAIRHLSEGSEPKPREVREALGKGRSTR